MCKDRNIDDVTYLLVTRGLMRALGIKHSPASHLSNQVFLTNKFVFGTAIYSVQIQWLIQRLMRVGGALWKFESRLYI